MIVIVWRLLGKTMDLLVSVQGMERKKKHKYVSSIVIRVKVLAFD